MTSEKDNLYAETRKLVSAFRFDADTARVFDDMIRRSVPGYPLMLDLLGVVASQMVQPNTRCYDLGCSLGASTLAIRHNISAKGCSVIAVDNSPAMIERCRHVIALDNSEVPVEIECADILNLPLANASLVSMNLTLQFIAPEKRLELLTRIADALVDGGVLFLSEKISFAETAEKELLTQLHHEFKRHQGYSELEIAQKRSAIENVLIPEALQTHRERLLAAGFSQVTVALQSLNFVSLLAIKNAPAP